MGIENYESGKDNVSRKVWESSNGTLLLTVTGLLSEGDYDITKKSDGDKIILQFEKQRE